LAKIDRYFNATTRIFEFPNSYGSNDLNKLGFLGLSLAFIDGFKSFNPGIMT